MDTQFCNEKSSCCGSGNQEKENKTEGNGMPDCMKKGKWFMLIPAVLLLSAFLGTFFLDAEIVRIIWLIVIGSILTLGFLGTIMMTFWMRNMKKELS